MKRPSPNEEGERAFSFRGVYTTEPLAAGTVIRDAHLKCVRPAAALAPADLPQIVGKTLKTDLPAHAAVRWDDVD